MMTKMKTIALVALILTFVFVTACSKNAASPSNSASSPPAGGASPSGTSSPSSSETPAPDMGGKKFTILTWVKEDVPSNDTKEGSLRLERQQEIEKKYNIKVEWKVVPWGKSIEMLTNAGLAGEPVADVLLLDLYFAYPAIQQGLLRPVDDLFDFSDPKWPANMTTFGNINGKMYGFKDFVNLGAGIYYNKTLFKREGLPDPHELAAKGEWNWNTFLDIAKKATKDTNGDGQIDQWGLVNHAGILSRLLISANGGKILERRDGKYVFTGGEPKAIEALKFLSDLYIKSKVAAPNKSGDFDDYTQSQKVFSSGKAAMITGELWEGKERKDMTDEQGFVLFPQGPSATEQDYKQAIENFTMYYMPANVKTPKESAKIWEDLILWDRLEQNKRALFEDQKLSSPEDVDAMMKATEYADPVFVPGNAGAAFYGATQSSIAIKGDSPEAAIEKIKQAAQADIDTTLNGKK